jgi:hypothetical protein
MRAQSLPTLSILPRNTYLRQACTPLGRRKHRPGSAPSDLTKTASGGLGRRMLPTLRWAGLFPRTTTGATRADAGQCRTAQDSAVWCRPIPPDWTPGQADTGTGSEGAIRGRRDARLRERCAPVIVFPLLLPFWVQHQVCRQSDSHQHALRSASLPALRRPALLRTRVVVEPFVCPSVCTCVMCPPPLDDGVAQTF